MLTPADRARGGRAAAAARRGAKAVRVVALEVVPPLESLDDAVTASAWLFKMAVSGTLDGVTVREANRSIATFVNSTNKRDLLARIKVLEKLVTQYEQERRRE
jgi:hypothetical protein